MSLAKLKLRIFFGLVFYWVEMIVEFKTLFEPFSPGGYSHTLHIRVCAAQRGRDFEAPDLERGIHFRGVF